MGKSLDLEIPGMKLVFRKVALKKIFGGKIFAPGVNRCILMI